MQQAEKIERCLCAYVDVALSERTRAVACAIVTSLGCFGECAGLVRQSCVSLAFGEGGRQMRVNLCKRHQEQVEGKEVQ